MLLTTSVSSMLFLIEKLFILFEIKSGSYDKYNLTLAEGSFHKFRMKKNNHVRTSILNIL